MSSSTSAFLKWRSFKYLFVLGLVGDKMVALKGTTDIRHVQIPGPDGEEIYVPVDEWNNWPGNDDQKRDRAFKTYGAASINSRPTYP